jgi:hypothetical protein
VKWSKLLAATFLQGNCRASNMSQHLEISSIRGGIHIKIIGAEGVDSEMEFDRGILNAEKSLAFGRWLGFNGNMKTNIMPLQDELLFEYSAMYVGYAFEVISGVLHIEHAGWSAGGSVSSKTTFRVRIDEKTMKQLSEIAQHICT